MPEHVDDPIDPNDPLSPGRSEDKVAGAGEIENKKNNIKKGSNNDGDDNGSLDSDDDDDDSPEDDDIMSFAGVNSDIVNQVETQELQTEHRKEEVKEKDLPEKKLTFNERLDEYYKAAPAFVFAYVKVFVIYVGILAIYWGAMFRRDTRFKNINYAVINEDAEFEFNGTTIQPYLGNAMNSLLFDNSTIRTKGDFFYPNMTEFRELARSHNNTLFQEMEHRIHHQSYWGGVYIAPNSTRKIYESFYNANGTFMTSGAINDSITVVYETGRHYTGTLQYLFRNLDFTGETWVKHYVYRDIYHPILTLLNTSQKRALLASNETVPIFSTFPVFTYIDNAPGASPEMVSVGQVQLIYALLLSFYSFSFSADTFGYMRKKLVYRNYLFFKFLISQIHCLILGLVFALMVKAFQVPTSLAFGKLGFVVLWMFMSLFISACGAANEVVILIVMAYDKKALIAPWMVFHIVSNVAVTFGPLDLLPGFFKYGYAMPMYNTYELFRVVYFNTWKGNMGRNIGVLLIWIVLGNIAILFISDWSTKKAKKKAREERRKQKEEEKRLDKEAGL